MENETFTQREARLIRAEAEEWKRTIFASLRLAPEGETGPALAVAFANSYSVREALKAAGCKFDGLAREWVAAFEATPDGRRRARKLAEGIGAKLTGEQITWDSPDEFFTWRVAWLQARAEKDPEKRAARLAQIGTRPEIDAAIRMSGKH